MSKKKKIIKTLIIVLVAIMALGALLVIKVSNTVKDMTETEVKTDVITQQYLVKSIGATGTVVSKDMKTVTGELAGLEIDDVFVEVGDFVNKGESILIFKSDDLEEDLEDAAEALKDAKKRVQLSKESQDRALEDAERNKEYQLDNAQDSLKTAEESISDLKEQIADAKEELDDLKNEEADANDEYKDAKEDLEDSDKKLEKAKTKLDEAEKALEDAEKAEDEAKKAYNKAKDALDAKKEEAESEEENTEEDSESTDSDATPVTISGNSPAVDFTEDEKKVAELKKAYDDAIAKREKAESDYDKAKDEYDKEFRNNTTLKLEAQSKESTYNTAKFARQSQETIIDTLESNLKDAEKSYDSGVKNYNNLVKTQESTIASVKNNKELTGLTSNTDMEEKQVEALEEQLEKIIVKAPMSGIVTSINYDAGDKYNSGAIAVIQDCSEYEIEAYVGEYDISDIKEGQKVLIKTDATRDEELEGTIDFVSPTGTKSGADTSYKIRIKLKDTNDRLRLDMSASLSIIIQEKENAVTVPYNAVQEDDNGKTFIEIKNLDDTFRKVFVDVLMESNYYTEIKMSDEIKVGDTIKIIEEESTLNPLEMLGVF